MVCVLIATGMENLKKWAFYRLEKEKSIHIKKIGGRLFFFASKGH
jgi:hypothetical protein